jgi:hypothetical protein
MKRNRILAAGAVVLLVLLGASVYASPWWQLRQLRAAVERHDADAVSAHVDFPALRDSVKGQLMASVSRDLAGETSANPLAGLGKSMALAFLNPMVDALVSPAGVIAMMENGKVNLARRHTAADAPPPRDEHGQPAYALGYRGWDTFALTWQQSEGSLVFKRQGLWGWKLAAIELGR